MSMLGFVCPFDNKPIKFKACISKPRCDFRCYPKPVLEKMRHVSFADVGTIFLLRAH